MKKTIMQLKPGRNRPLSGQSQVRTDDKLETRFCSFLIHLGLERSWGAVWNDLDRWELQVQPAVRDSRMHTHDEQSETTSALLSRTIIFISCVYREDGPVSKRQSK